MTRRMIDVTKVSRGSREILSRNGFDIEAGRKARYDKVGRCVFSTESF